MNLKEASKVLIVDLDGITDAAVSAAFAARVKEVHPDTAPKETALQGAMLQVYKTARDRLMKHVKQQQALVDCSRCGGEGVIVNGMGVAKRKCIRCNGEGRVMRKGE